jgi:Uma2 family endonuclease
MKILRSLATCDFVLIRLQRSKEAAMTVTMDKPMSLEAALDELELSPGYKAELIEGEIIVTPPANREHESVISELTRAIVLHTEFRTAAGSA